MNKHKGKRRVCRSIKAPFSVDDLQSFANGLPKKAFVRLVSVSSGGNGMDSSPKESSFIEALWWEKVDTPAVNPAEI